MRKFVILLLCLVPLACSPEKGWTDPEPIHPDNPQTNNIDPSGNTYFAKFTYKHERKYGSSPFEFTVRMTISFDKYDHANVAITYGDYGKKESSSTYSVSGDVVTFQTMKLYGVEFEPSNYFIQTANFAIYTGYLSAHALALDVELVSENVDVGKTTKQNVHLVKQ